MLPRPVEILDGLLDPVSWRNSNCIITRAEMTNRRIK